MVDDQDSCEWVNVFFLVLACLCGPGQRAIKQFY